MIKIFILLAVSFILCAAQVEQRTYANCETAGTEPCISNIAFGKSVGETLAANIQCAASSSSLFVRDTEGYQILDPITLQTVTDQRLNCPYLLISRRQYGGYYVVLQSTQSTLAADGSKCWCEGASGSCQIRVIHFNVSNGESLVTALPIIGNTKTSSIYHLQSDIVEAPVQIRDCKFNSTESAPFSTYEWAQTQGGDALIDYPRDIFSLCPVDIQSKAAQSVSTLGYRFIMTGGNAAGSYASVSRFFDANGVGSLNVDGEDYLWVQERLFAGLNMTWSAGPSYLSSVPAPATGDAPVGLGRIDAVTGALIRNSSIVLTGEHILEEGESGRTNFLWVTAANGDLFRVTSVDMTDPANPITVNYEETIPFRMLNFSECYGTNVLGGGKWHDVDGGDWPLGCPTIDGRNYGFATAMSSASIEAFRAVAFFQSGGETYVALGFPSTGIPCASCLPTTFLQQIMDIWQLSGVAQPQLVERIEAGAFTQPTGSIAVTFQDTFVSQQGLFFYTNVSAPGNVLHWFPISGSGSALASGLTSYQTFVDASVPTDAITFDRYQPTPDTLLVNYWADGTVIYNVGPSGIISVNASYSSFDNPVAVSATSGAMESCFSSNGNFYRLNYNANPVGATGGAFFSVDLQLFQPFAPNSSTSSTTSSTSSSTTADVTSTTTTSTSTTSGGALPSPSTAAASPSASTSPGCLTPDSCKFECSKPDEPSKVPKPSVNPSKVPAPSKVPVQRVFTIELTYEATAAECGPNAPDCCDVNEWLGDDSVAASFFLCNSDSTTKNRAPTHDSKDGTCTVFLAAQEGTDAGKITQAEFDAAVATLEGSFDALCPTDVKNCDVSTQSGKTIAYVLGGSSAMRSVSLLLLLLGALFAGLP